MSLRKLAVLLRHLPEGSACQRAIAGPDAAWRLEHHLLASIFDRLGMADYHFVSANTDKAPPKPTPLPRPGVAQPVDGERLGNTQTLNMAEVRAYLDRMAPPEVD